MLEGLKTATASIFPRSKYIRGAPEGTELIDDCTDAELIIEELDGICKDRKRKLVSALKAAITPLPEELWKFWENRQDHTDINAGLNEFHKVIKDLPSYKELRPKYINFIKRHSDDIDRLSKLERLIDDFVISVLNECYSTTSSLNESNLLTHLQDHSIKAKIQDNFSLDCVSELAKDRLPKSGAVEGYSLYGLALSGGGIRSATFCLGVMQKLAAVNILKNFDYVSSVSGGGFTSAGLLWWLRRTRRAGEAEADLHLEFPYGIDDPTDPPHQSAQSKHSRVLNYLRRSGNYLVPGNGITLWSGVIAVLRAIFLSLIVWIPLFMGLFIILYYLECILYCIYGTDCLSTCKASELGVFYSALGLAIAAGVIFSLFCLGHSLVSTKKIKTYGSNLRISNRRSFIAVSVATLFYILLAYVLINETVFENRIDRFLNSIDLGDLANALTGNNAEAVGAFVVFIIVLFTMLLLLVPASLSIRGMWDYDNSEEAGYISRRAFERYFGAGFLPVIFLIAIATVPVVFSILEDKLIKGGMVGVFSVFAGAVTGLFGHLQARNAKADSRFTEIMLIMGSILLIYGITLLGYGLAKVYVSPKDYWPDYKPNEIRAAFLALLIIGLYLGFRTNINGIALHQYYRDRLMEAFMPDYNTVDKGINAPAREADRFLLKDISSPELFPIINTNVILVKSEVRKYLNRGGDNFILTPKRCGSNATGWSETLKFRGGNLSLATAVAISGAAANPNAGVGGAGVTRNRVVSLAMLLLALRLGYWVESPAQRSKLISTKDPHHFYPAGIYSWGWTGYNESSHFLELSDGGHFENLGLYELVRRRCGVILLCDGGRDALASYSDFITAIRRVEEDFGAQFVFEENYGPELLISSLPDQPTYPSGAKYSRQGYFLARIKYHKRGRKPWSEEGILIYLKSSMVKNVSLKVKGYKGAHPDFPDESTGDQFFDEEQFEAYRELGYSIASDMLRDLEGAKVEGTKVVEKIFGGHALCCAEAIVKAWTRQRAETGV